jgi:hypothetical protein
MNSKILLILTTLLASHYSSASIADFVAQAIDQNDLKDALFLTKALQSTDQREANIGYRVLLNSSYFSQDKKKLDSALAQISVGSTSQTEQFKNHTGQQAVDDMIAMFKSGPGAAAYKKLAPTQQQQALNIITQAFEATKSMLQ